MKENITEELSNSLFLNVIASSFLVIFPKLFREEARPRARSPQWNAVRRAASQSSSLHRGVLFIPQIPLSPTSLLTDSCTRWCRNEKSAKHSRGEFCPSVCLSVTRVIPGKTEERSVQIFIPYERIFISLF